MFANLHDRLLAAYGDDFLSDEDEGTPDLDIRYPILAAEWIDGAWAYSVADLEGGSPDWLGYSEAKRAAEEYDKDKIEAQREDAWDARREAM